MGIPTPLPGLDVVARLREHLFPTWVATSRLRVLERHYPSGYTSTKLQQLWRSCDGREHWRDVPVVVEKVTLDE